MCLSLCQQNETDMDTNKIILTEKAIVLSREVNSQLRMNGVTNHKGQIVKPLSTFPETEWKQWMLEKIEIMKAAWAAVENA